MVNCRKRQRGGAIRMPSEYFGVDSGRYTDNANAGLCPNAYGDTHAQSFGMPLNDQSVGPNMHVHPNATGMQTGGAKKRRRRRTARTRCGGKKKIVTDVNQVERDHKKRNNKKENNKKKEVKKESNFLKLKFILIF